MIQYFARVIQRNDFGQKKATNLVLLQNTIHPVEVPSVKGHHDPIIDTAI